MNKWISKRSNSVEIKLCNILINVSILVTMHCAIFSYLKSALVVEFIFTDFDYDFEFCK